MDDADMIRITRGIDELDDPKFTGHNMNHNIGTAMARVVRKVMTTDESMKPEIDAVAARVREYRMRRVHLHGKTGPQRADADMTRAVRALAGRLTLPKSVESRAVHLLRRMWKLKMTLGRPWPTLAGTALLIASRESGGSLRPIDVAEVIE